MGLVIVIKELRSKGIKTAIIRTIICVPFLPVFLPSSVVYFHNEFGVFGVGIANFFRRIDLLDLQAEYTIWYAVLFMTISLGLIIFIITRWIFAFRGGPLRGILKFVNESNNPKETLQQLENVWVNGKKMYSIRMGGDYIIYRNGLDSAVIYLHTVKYMNGDIVPIGGRQALGHLRVHYDDGRELTYIIDDSELDPVLDFAKKFVSKFKNS